MKQWGGGPIGKSIPSDAAGGLLHGSCRHGNKGAGERKGQKEDDTHHSVYVLFRARLPIYVLFSEMFFPQKALLVAYSLYCVGLAVAILGGIYCT